MAGVFFMPCSQVIGSEVIGSKVMGDEGFDSEPVENYNM